MQCKNRVHYVPFNFSVKYFSIVEQTTGKTLDATHVGDVIFYSYHGNENQQWSWDDLNKTTLVNKKYNNSLVFNSQGV